ncbi:hypothetical protein PG988_014488 [Apiospora saccharicola]
MDPPQIESFAMDISPPVLEDVISEFVSITTSNQTKHAGLGRNLTPASPKLIEVVQVPPAPAPSPIRRTYFHESIDDLGSNSENQSPQTDECLKLTNPCAALNNTRYTETKDACDASSDFYDISKPTCSLNLVCYRSEADGCHRQQIQCALRSRYTSNVSFKDAIKANPSLIYTDHQLFGQMKRLFETKLQGSIRSRLSLKTLKAFRVLAYTPTTRPSVVPLDSFVLQEMMYAYRNPDKLGTKDAWVQWAFQLRQKNRRHAIEFVEGWDATRIATAAMIPWLGSCVVGIAWTLAGGDPQTTFTVASFILTSSSILLALLAIVSSIG